MLTPDIKALEGKAEQLAETLRALANDKRLLILCKLSQEEEMSVTALADAVAISLSGLSQHLSKLRAEKLVATRRDSQTIYYRLCDDKTKMLMTALHSIYCSAPQ